MELSLIFKKKKKKLKRVGELKSALTEFGVYPAGFLPCFVPVFLHYLFFLTFSDGNVHPVHCMFEICALHFDFKVLLK